MTNHLSCGESKGNPYYEEIFYLIDSKTKHEE